MNKTIRSYAVSISTLKLGRLIFCCCFVIFLREISGSKTFVAKRFLPRGGKEKEGVTVKEVNSTYFWNPLVNIDFSVGVVVPVSHADDQLKSLEIPAGKFWNHLSCRKF